MNSICGRMGLCKGELHLWQDGAVQTDGVDDPTVNINKWQRSTGAAGGLQAMMLSVLTQDRVHSRV